MRAFFKPRSSLVLFAESSSADCWEHARISLKSAQSCEGYLAVRTVFANTAQMGIRSCVYAAYFAFTALLFLLVTGFQWGGVLPSLPDCKLSCGVAVIQPLLLIGTPNTPCDTTDQNQQYYNNCFLCGTAGVEWPCPPISGAPGCMAGSTRIAETCVGQPGAVTVAGQPIVSDKSPDLAQCAAKLGTSATPDVCDKCIAAGQCVSGTKFEGAGSYTDVSIWHFACNEAAPSPADCRLQVARQLTARFVHLSSLTQIAPLIAGGREVPLLHHTT